MEVKVQIKGLREIGEAMKSLPGRMDQRLLHRGLTAGARLVRDDARARVPMLQVPDPRRTRGLLRRMIQVARVRPEPGMRATVWVRMRMLSGRRAAAWKQRMATSGKRWAGSFNPNDPYYWKFVEFGTSKMPARPFMRPAFESRKLAAVEMAIATLRPLVQDAIANTRRPG